MVGNTSLLPLHAFATPELGQSIETAKQGIEIRRVKASEIYKTLALHIEKVSRYTAADSATSRLFATAGTLVHDISDADFEDLPTARATLTQIGSITEGLSDERFKLSALQGLVFSVPQQTTNKLTDLTHALSYLSKANEPGLTAAGLSGAVSQVARALVDEFVSFPFGFESAFNVGNSVAFHARDAVALADQLDPRGILATSVADAFFRHLLVRPDTLAVMKKGHQAAEVASVMDQLSRRSSDPALVNAKLAGES